MGVVAALGFWIVLAQVGSPIVTPPSDSHVTVTENVTVQVPPPDPKTTADMAAWSFEGIFVNVIAPQAVKWTNDVLDVPDFVRHTPPGLTYDNGGVKTVEQVVRFGSYAIVGLLLLAWAIGKMTGQEPSLSRSFAAAAFAAGNLIWWHIMIDGLNALNDTIAPPDLHSIVQPHLNPVSVAGDPAEAFGPSILLIAYCVVIVLLIVSQFFRLAVIDILIMIGALGWMCMGADQTQSWYSKYLGLSVGTLASQILVVAALRLAPILGIIGGGFVSALLGLCVLLLARSMPKMLSSMGHDGGGHGGRIGLLVLRKLVAKL